MATFDIFRREQDRLGDSPWKRFTRWLRRRLPMGLYARSLLIIIIPMVLLQSVVAFVFMERHWQLVTQRLSNAVTRDVAALVDLIETYPQDPAYTEIIRIARERLDLNIVIDPGGELPPPRPKPFFSILDQILSEEISGQIRLPFWIDTVGESKIIEIRIKLQDKILRVYAQRNYAYASNTHIFLVWMVGTSLVLLGIAILFLRGQIRPILALTKAAESFGKGQRSDDFSPRGADEVRRAGLAFMRMRERIERQMEQRTAMLTGVSHDLRTILTRFKLELALAGSSNSELDNLNQDVNDMQVMLEGYLAFAKGEAEEDVGQLRLSTLLARLEADARLTGKKITSQIEGDDEISVRPNAFTRLVTNIVSNACRHAGTIEIDARHRAKWLTITIDDDGPGIPETAREDVFKPFFRLDEARNLNASGTGLGLAIAKDIATSHGGTVALSDSPLGGLRVTIRVPA